MKKKIEIRNWLFPFETFILEENPKITLSVMFWNEASFLTPNTSFYRKKVGGSIIFLRVALLP